jgi:glutathione S-transferase
MATGSGIEVTALRWVPEGARGLVRDIRVRWALEEAGLPYSIRPIEMRMDLRDERPAAYLAQNPFGQVPVYREGEVTMFESGAIVLHIAESSEALLPRDPHGRGRATSWLVAALNSVEPEVWAYAALNFFYSDQDWAKQAAPIYKDNARKRLEPVAAYLGDKEWLEGEFTAGDLMMVAVLRIFARTDLTAEFPTLTEYVKRGDARPAFQRAFAAQIADFDQQPSA